MTLTKKDVERTEEIMKRTIEEIVKILEKNGISHEIAVMIAPITAKLTIDSITEEVE